jgi:hypothetical protein
VLVLKGVVIEFAKLKFSPGLRYNIIKYPVPADDPDVIIDAVTVI